MNRPETIEETAQLVEKAGGRGIAVEVDHLVFEEVSTFVNRIRCEQSRLHNRKLVHQTIADTFYEPEGLALLSALLSLTGAQVVFILPPPRISVVPDPFLRMAAEGDRPRRQNKLKIRAGVGSSGS